jgi:transposase
VRTETITTKRDNIQAFLDTIDSKTCFFLEAGTMSSWMARLIDERGHMAVVVDPNRLRLIACSTKKTDKHDAATLAMLGRAGLVEAVRVRSEETEQLRYLIASRSSLVKARRSLVQAARSQALSTGHRWPHADTDEFAFNLLQGKWTMPPEVAESVPHLARSIESATTEILALEDKRALHVPRVQDTYDRLTSVPGVGRITALTFISHIEDPTRFKNGDQVASYLGLVPAVRESGGKRSPGHITKRGKKSLRVFLVEAAHAFLRSKEDSALKRWAEKLASRIGGKKASVALARKLCRLLWKLWTTQSSWKPWPNAGVRPKAI